MPNNKVDDSIDKDFTGVDFLSGYNNNLKWLLRNTIPLYTKGLTDVWSIHNVENIIENIDGEDVVTHFRSEINKEFYDFLQNTYPEVEPETVNIARNITATHIKSKMPIKENGIKTVRWNVDYFLITLDGLYAKALQENTNIFVKYNHNENVLWYNGCIDTRPLRNPNCTSKITQDIDKNETYFKFYIPEFVATMDLLSLNPNNIELFTDFNASIYGYNGFKQNFEYYEEDSKYYIKLPVDSEYIFAKDWEFDTTEAQFHLNHRIKNQSIDSFFDKTGTLVIGDENFNGANRNKNILLFCTSDQRADPNLNANTSRTTNSIYRKTGNIVSVQTALLIPQRRIHDDEEDGDNDSETASQTLLNDNDIHEYTMQWEAVISKCLTSYGDRKYLDAMSSPLNTRYFKEKDFYIIEANFQFVVSSSSVSQKLFQRSVDVNNYRNNTQPHNPNYC